MIKEQIVLLVREREREREIRMHNTLNNKLTYVMEGLNKLAPAAADTANT